MKTYAVDRLYHIMDYSSNYYKVDDKNQLVVAGDENDATVFSFAEANRRIGAGAKSRFYYVIPIEDDLEDTTEEEESESFTFDNTLVSAARELAETESPDNVEKTITDYDLAKIDWKEYLTHFTFIVSGLRDYKKALVKSQSEVDQKICDILHYIELCDTSDEESGDIVELLKICRENRREIKDELLRVDSFQKNFGTTANATKAKEVIKAIKGLETRKYTPRKFTELFEGGTIAPQHKATKSQTETIPLSCDEDIFFDCGEEDEKMDYVRKETIFDGRENDWVAFAAMQADFYSNAKQYIINIQIDIDEIDDEIMDLMNEIEVSNCNVTQGYKLFKRLKDLRLSKRQKEKELESLYILTEHFNVGKMAEECEKKYEEIDTYLNGVIEEGGDDKKAMDEETEIEENDKIVGLAG